ncbi:GNAT family N-acetyltransferase [Paenibacillus sp. TRM 82003]|nr:GNAT family N-acetyltransferase [Paenibacillus sp. TRM 82003]
MSHVHIRALRHPDDYAAVAPLLNAIYPEPTTAERIQEEEEKIPPGQLHYGDDGLLRGWDRPKWVAETADGQVVAYAIAWRAPWTEPGALSFMLVVHPERRNAGIGNRLYEEAERWALSVRASRFIVYVREKDTEAAPFAERRGFERTRHTFESVLPSDSFDRPDLWGAIADAENGGIRFTTLAEEPGEPSERKLHELYAVTHRDIPGHSGDFPWFEEWSELDGARPEWFHIAKDGERYVGVAALVRNEQTQAMYHEYTGVLPEYRGRRIALALKLRCLRSAGAANAPYLKTHNDSMNAPMLRINRDLLGFRAEPGSYRMDKELTLP